MSSLRAKCLVATGLNSLSSSRRTAGTHTLCHLDEALKRTPSATTQAWDYGSRRTRLCEKSHCLRWNAGTGWSACKNPLSGRRECQRSQQGLHSEDVGHPLEVVTEDAQGQLGLCLFQPLHQE